MNKENPNEKLTNSCLGWNYRLSQLIITTIWIDNFLFRCVCECACVFALESDKPFRICCIASVLICSVCASHSLRTSYNSVCYKNLDAFQRFMRSYVNDFQQISNGILIAWKCISWLRVVAIQFDSEDVIVYTLKQSISICMLTK